MFRKVLICFLCVTVLITVLNISTNSIVTNEINKLTAPQMESIQGLWTPNFCSISLGMAAGIWAAGISMATGGVAGIILSFSFSVGTGVLIDYVCG